MTDQARLDRLCAAALTYPQVGATAGTLPAEFGHVRRVEVVGHGRARFRAAIDALMTWQMHRDAGLTVSSSTATAEPGSVVLLGLGLGRLRLKAPCRVVYVVDEPQRRGFAYGTLPGHPEQGEEAFVVELHDDGDVSVTITAFSRPARWFARLGGPVSRLAQRTVTERYVRALRSAVRFSP